MFSKCISKKPHNVKLLMLLCATTFKTSTEIMQPFIGTESLKEKSASVIMSTLLQQRSLELNQLYGSLPCYVPPTVKRYIIHQYVVITHQKHHPVSPGLELESPIVLPFPTPC